MNIKSIRLATCLLFICAISSCGGFPESTFPLASACRLPKWIHVEAAGRYISGKVELYVRKQGREAKFIFFDGKGDVIAETVGLLEGSAPSHLKDEAGKDVMYEKISVGGIHDAFRYEYSSSQPSICMMDFVRASEQSLLPSQEN